LQELCRQRGIPFTVQRRATYEALLSRADHPTADQVYEEVQATLPDVSRMTVYRVLDLLVDMGLVKKVSHPGCAVRFDPDERQHHHLVCLECNKILDFQEGVLDDLKVPRAARRLGFEVSGYYVQFRGLCADCRQKEGSPGRRAARTRGRASRTRHPGARIKRREP
jgi:Fur family peroxide stress response transcriptional regulator